MSILSLLRPQHKRLDAPARATRRQRAGIPTIVALDVNYLSAREWIDLNIVSGRTFDFAALRDATVYGPNHPWQWRITSETQRAAAQRLRAVGIIIPGAADPQHVQLSLEGFVRVLRGSWGNNTVALIPIKAGQR